MNENEILPPWGNSVAGVPAVTSSLVVIPSTSTTREVPSSTTTLLVTLSEVIVFPSIDVCANA